MIKRAVLVVCGALTVGLALFGQQLGLAFGVQPFSVGQIIFMLLGMLLILIGVTNEERTAARLTKLSVFISKTLMATVVTILAMEIISIICLNTLTWKTSRADHDHALELWDNPYYATVDWGQAFWKEGRLVNTIYASYLGWNNAPIQGQYINVDANGIRKTPGAQCQDDSYTVFVLGGSTVYGVGSPDWGTIPAYLQTLLTAHINKPVCVVNLGGLNFVSTQEVVSLTLQLQQGHIPNLVIFYDGPNDVYSAYQSGQAGQQMNFGMAQTSFAAISPDPFINWLSQWNTYRLLRLLILTSPDKQPQSVTYQTIGVDRNKLADEIMQTYAGNRQLVDHLASSYNFQTAFFWQPVITETEKPMIGEERKMILEVDPAERDLYAATDQRAEQDYSQTGHFYSLVHVLDNTNMALWIDTAHIVPEGNSVIAQAIANILLEDVIKS